MGPSVTLPAPQEQIPGVDRGVDQVITGASAVITLDRPRALNALTCTMRAALGDWFSAYPRDPQIYAVVLQSASPKAFCAGSDVREVLGLAAQDIERARQTFRDEYALNWRIECFSKPLVSLIDGLVMGGGVGITLYGTHRIAGAGYQFAMPETLIGLFPDVGVCHAFARMPAGVGRYLALTGRAIGRADALRLGLVTHCIERADFATITAGLADAAPVDPLLDGLHADPGPGDLEPFYGVIADCFSGTDVADILTRLGRVGGVHRVWASEVSAELRARAPLSLAITSRHVQAAAGVDLREVLHQDYRLACRFLEDSDFAEGVRALLVDKDGTPRWRPARIEDVTPAMVERYFAPLGAGELDLPTRAQMQAARA